MDIIQKLGLLNKVSSEFSLNSFVMKTQFNHLAINDSPDTKDKFYYIEDNCTKLLSDGRSEGFTVEAKWILMTRKYPFLLGKLEKYFELFPNKVKGKLTDGTTLLTLTCINVGTFTTIETLSLLLKVIDDANFKEFILKNGIDAILKLLKYNSTDEKLKTTSILLRGITKYDFPNTNNYRIIKKIFNYVDTKSILESTTCRAFRMPSTDHRLSSSSHRAERS